MGSGEIRLQNVCTQARRQGANGCRAQNMGSGYAPEPKMLEATIGFEPMIEVLQTSALPLGHVAAGK